MLVVCVPLSAQIDGRGAPDISKANVRFGRVLLNPTLALTNLGIDTNVFNEAEPRQPRRDLTITITPQTDLWLRLGRSWLIGNVTEDLVWYQEFASERTANTSAKIGVLAPLNRLTLRGGAAYLRTRDRPGYEIDARSKRRELGFEGGLELRVLSKTFVGVLQGALVSGVRCRGVLVDRQAEQKSRSPRLPRGYRWALTSGSGRAILGMS